mmetsp:Transcript_29443/g.74013  ORF Transcript_29443/g.74013 Transcript_29443/m.74013 type:complete len:217 (-) Transcript_29443:560-1210(-)
MPTAASALRACLLMVTEAKEAVDIPRLVARWDQPLTLPRLRSEGSASAPYMPPIPGSSSSLLPALRLPRVDRPRRAAHHTSPPTSTSTAKTPTAAPATIGIEEEVAAAGAAGSLGGSDSMPAGRTVRRVPTATSYTLVQGPPPHAVYGSPPSSVSSTVEKRTWAMMVYVPGSSAISSAKSAAPARSRSAAPAAVWVDRPGVSATNGVHAPTLAKHE